MESLEQTLNRIKSNINSKIEFDYYVNNFKTSSHPFKNEAIDDINLSFPQYAEDIKEKQIRILSEINKSKADPAQFDY